MNKRKLRKRLAAVYAQYGALANTRLRIVCDGEVYLDVQLGSAYALAHFLDGTESLLKVNGNVGVSLTTNDLLPYKACNV